MTEPVLSIRNLSVDIPTRQGVVKPVDAISYDIGRGEILGVVGESGAGKSMAGNAVIGLLNPPAHISGGEIWLNGVRIDPLKGGDTVGLAERLLEQVGLHASDAGKLLIISCWKKKGWRKVGARGAGIRWWPMGLPGTTVFPA